MDKQEKGDKRMAILKKAGKKLTYYGVKYAIGNTALGASMTNAGMTAVAGMVSLGPVGAVIAVGFIIGMICFTMRKTKKGVVTNNDYETMLEDSAKYERRVEEKAQLDKQALIDSIFNEDTYSEIKKAIPKDKDKAFLATYIGTEYGKLLLELYAKELFNKKKDQVGGGGGLVDDLLNNIDTHESSKSEQPNEIIAKIYEMFEVDIADNTNLFYKAVTDEILVLFPLLYQNTKKKKALSNFVNPNDLRLNTLCGLRLTELNTKLEKRRQNLELINIPKNVIIDDPKPIDDTYFKEWEKNPSSSKNYYSLSFKNALVKKRDFYLSILKNRYEGEVKQILKFNIVTPPTLTAKTFSDKIEFFKKFLAEYDEILVNKKKEKISEITDKTDSELFTKDTYKGKKKLVIDENGKIGGKYPYYTVDVLEKGTYKVDSIDKEKVILQDNIIILINPKDTGPSRKIINDYLIAKLDIKFTNIRALYNNIKSRENYLDISSDINTIYTELENTEGDDNIRGLIARFKVINDNIKGNNSKYTDKHNADVERKKTLISSIEKDEAELKILTEGCEILKQKSLDFYMDKDKKIYTKEKGNIKYIENIEKQHKELVKFIGEAAKSLNKSSIKNKVKRLSINAALLKGQAELDQKINSIGDIIPDINRIAVKLQFYESEKMAKNMLKASLINNGLKLEMVKYISTELEKLEAIIYSSEDSPIFNDSLFKEKVQLLKIAPFDINATKKGDEMTITERDGVFNLNGELIEYNVLKEKFQKGVENLTLKLSKFMDDINVTQKEEFILLDDLYGYKVNNDELSLNSKLSNYNKIDNHILNMVTNTRWYNNEVLLKKNAQEYIMVGSVYKIHVLNNNIITNYLVIHSPESKIFLDENVYKPLNDNKLADNTINSLKNIGSTFTLNDTTQSEIIAYSLDNNKIELIKYNSLIYVSDILFIIKIKDGKIGVKDRQLINENHNYFIVNGPCLDKDPSKIYSMDQINKPSGKI